MTDINNKLDGLNELVTRIDAKILEISTKLDELIKALHEYDGNDEYGESSFEAFMDDEEAANKRMDIIGQNGNEGSHYVTNEEADEDAATFNDYGMRVVKDRDSNNTQDKRTGGDKDKRTAKDRRKYYKPKQTK
jgi:hypothetical protein